jgi:hypothetical protein
MKTSRSPGRRPLEGYSAVSPPTGWPPARSSPPSGVFEIGDARAVPARGVPRRSGAKPRLCPIDDSIFLVRWPELMLPSELDEHLEDLVAVARDARGSVAFVIDMTICLVPSAQVRNDVAKKLAVAYGKAGHRVAGVSHVIASPLVRGLVTAVHWLSPAPFPTHVADSIHECVSWLRAILKLQRSQPRATRRT